MATQDDLELPDDLDFSTPVGRSPASEKSPVDEVIQISELEDPTLQQQKMEEWKQLQYQTKVPDSVPDAIMQAAKNFGTQLKDFLGVDGELPKDAKDLPGMVAKGIKDTIQSIYVGDKDLPSEQDIVELTEGNPELQKAMLKDIAQSKQLLAGFRNTIGDIVDVAQMPFTVPQRLLVGNVMRLVDPELAKRRAAEDDRLGRSALVKVMNQVAPPLYAGSDYAAPKIRDFFKGLNPEDGDALESWGDGLAAVSSVAVDTITDPLFFTSFFQPKGSTLLDDMMRMGARTDLPKAPYGDAKLFITEGRVDLAPVIRDSRSVVKVGKGPFSFELDSPKLRTWMSEKAAKFETSRPGLFASTFPTRTVSEPFNMSRNVHVIERNSIAPVIDDIGHQAISIIGGKKLDDGVSRYATWLAENGAEGAEKIAKFHKLNLSASQRLEAQRLSEAMKSWRQWGAESYERITGEKVPKFLAPSPDDAKKLLADNEDLKKLYESLPDEMKPYFFSSNADLPRRLSPEVVKRMNEVPAQSLKIREQQSLLGLKRTADSLKERDKIATWVADLSRTPDDLGSFFDNNIVRTTQRSVQDMLRVAVDKKFMKTVQEIGMTADEWRKAIDAAKFAVAQVGPDLVPYSTLRLANMDPANLRPLSADAFEAVKKIAPAELSDDIRAASLQRKEFAKRLEVTKSPEEAAFLRKQMADLDYDLIKKKKRASKFGYYENKELLFEPSVALAIDAQFAPETAMPLAKFGRWANAQMSKSYLSSIRRTMPQFMEAASSSFGHAGVRDYMAVFLSRFKKDEPRRLFQMAGLDKGVALDFDVVNRIPISPEIVMNADLNAGISNAMSTVHNLSMEKELLSSVEGFWKKAGKEVLQSPRKFIEKWNDWWLPATVRDVVNGGENIPKEAVFRAYLRKFNGDAARAADYTGRTMMDFRFTSGGVRKYIQPNFLFGNYLAKSFERLPFLITKNPWVVNMTDADRGHIARALNEVYDWSPVQDAYRKEIFGPVPTSDIIYSSVLPGAGEAVKHKEHVNLFLNRLSMALTGSPENIKGQNGTDKLIEQGPFFQVYHKLPTFFSGPRDMVSGVFTAPGLAGNLNPVIQGLALMAGYDFQKGGALPLDKTEEGFVNRSIEALSRLNPVRSPQFWTVARALMDKFGEKHEKALMLGEDEQLMKAALGFAGVKPGLVDNELRRLEIKADKRKAIIETLTMGLFRLSQPDVQFQMHMRGLLAERAELMGAMRKAALKKSKFDVERYKGAIMRLNDKIERTLDFRDAYESGISAIRQNPDLEGLLIEKETSNLLDLSPQQEEPIISNPNNLPKQGEDVPEDLEFEDGQPVLPDDLEEDADRAPQSDGPSVRFVDPKNPPKARADEPGTVDDDKTMDAKFQLIMESPEPETTARQLFPASSTKTIQKLIEALKEVNGEGSAQPKEENLGVQ